MADDGTLHVAKYTTARDTLPIERVEVATLKLAGAAGLRAAPCQLALADTEHPVALIRRFDRAGAERLHYVSAQSFLGLAPGEEGSYADIADAMRSACGAALPDELRELHRRVLFSILVSNDDDHLKNHGFLHTGEHWRLAPAFDVNPNADGSTHLKTGISEPGDTASSLDAAVEAAPYFERDPDDAASDALRMARVIAGGWRPLCARMGMDGRACARYEAAFAGAVELAATQK